MKIKKSFKPKMKKVINIMECKTNSNTKRMMAQK